MNTPKLPRYLYKYRAFDANALRQLDLAEVYYADPSKFNDPLDCNPTIQVDKDLQSLERLLSRMLVRSSSKENALAEIDNHRYMSTEYGDYKTDPVAKHYYTRRLADHVDRVLAAELGRYGVLSLSAKWDCPLMWSHYGDEHRGLCIQYDTSNSAFYNLKAVSYSSPRAVRISDLIEWKIEGKAAAKERIYDTYFFSKAPQWRYEREWRDLTGSAGASHAPAYVSAVLFGMRCDAAVINTIVRLHANSDRSIKFYAIRPLDGSFRLRKHVVDKEEIEASGVRGPAVLDFRDVFIDETAT
jgi:hypothetical protein